MPRFRVHFSRITEERASIIIFARDHGDAVIVAHSLSPADFEWSRYGRAEPVFLYAESLEEDENES